jgi:hypothetical protein
LFAQPLCLEKKIYWLIILPGAVGIFPWSLSVEESMLKELRIIDAIGPETFTYDDFLKLIASELHRNIAFVQLSPSIGIFLGKLIGLFVKDIVLTKDEVRGLMVNKLTSTQDPNGKTCFSEWLRINKDFIGKAYISELGRHFYWNSVS